MDRQTDDVRSQLIDCILKIRRLITCLIIKTIISYHCSGCCCCGRRRHRHHNYHHVQTYWWKRVQKAKLCNIKAHFTSPMATRQRDTRRWQLWRPSNHLQHSQINKENSYNRFTWEVLFSHRLSKQSRKSPSFLRGSWNLWQILYALQCICIDNIFITLLPLNKAVFR